MILQFLKRWVLRWAGVPVAADPTITTPTRFTLTNTGRQQFALTDDGMQGFTLTNNGIQQFDLD